MKIKRTFALPLKNGVAVKAVSSWKDGRLNKKVEKSFKKIWRLKNKAYLCNPNQKRGLSGGNSKFIEKTDLLYKKQVPRNTIYREALILLKNYKCQDKLRNLYRLYNEEFDPGSG